MSTRRSIDKEKENSTRNICNTQQLLYGDRRKMTSLQAALDKEFNIGRETLSSFTNTFDEINEGNIEKSIKALEKCIADKTLLELSERSKDEQVSKTVVSSRDSAIKVIQSLTCCKDRFTFGSYVTHLRWQRGLGCY